MTGAPLFDVAGVTYRYEAVTALDGLSLRIEAGKRVAGSKPELNNLEPVL